MKLIDVTNSYGTLVSKQLENTDATYVKVYSMGKTLVVHSIADTHIEVVIVNKSREVKEFEVDYVLEEILDRGIDKDDLSIIRTTGVVEISMKVRKKKVKTNTEK
ncbi:MULTISPECIES: DUF1827 family protein [Vagococcus]|uniref:DUF1827 family protein n=1 Tax=Vagococcus fluvialis bH819 TaxID=1255619 RepID=A0A1X6WKZ2_9ENTE|nr:MULTISPECIES: DUF1827 family protein [Vagococcus]SLM84920.1 hypothetical protein FM121_02415 [Vagococcus fluvialis bH819]HCM90460.1 DUF1827 domain-containing protein [Vagococcus sp.]